MSEQWRRDELIANIMSLRTQLMRTLMDPRRDFNFECGYPETGELNAFEYRKLYDREPIATRVVQLMPKECWQSVPEVYETEDGERSTPFEEDFDNLTKSLRGEESYYQDQDGSPLWEEVRNADINSGVGAFGVLFVGVDDGLEYYQPAYDGGGTDAMGGDGTEAQYDDIQPTGEGTEKPPGEGRRLLFLRSFDESLVQITQYESDKKSPRFGLPIMYLLTFNDPQESRGGVGLTTTQVRVHWTRVVHLADNTNTSKVFGVPRMRPVLNRLLDLVKLYGGSAEMYWRGAFPGYSLETTPQLGGDVIIDKAALQEDFDSLTNGLQRYIALMGMQMKSLAPQVVDPTAQISIQLEAVCIQLGCPIRVFKGSERGELASGQDDASWNDRIRERRTNYITPRIIVPLIDLLIRLQILSKPKGYSVKWPDLDAQTVADKANVALVKTQAAAAYVSGGVEALVPPHDFLTRFLGETDEVADQMIDEAKKATADDAMTLPPPGEDGHPATPPPKPILPPGAAPGAGPKPTKE